MMETLRKRDMAVERSLAQFLDEHLYTKPIFENVKRTDDLDEQMGGSDIVLSIPSIGIINAIVDEKAQLFKNYINHPLPTFSLELSFKSHANEIVTGWFIDKSKSTTHYMFLWITKALNPEWSSADDFQEVEYALVNRQKLLDYFSSKGLTMENLQDKAVHIRRNNTYGRSEENPMYWFFFSEKLYEQPINIVVRKSLYMQLADIKGIITK